MQVHLVDGTYEPFRYFYSPGGGHANSAGEQVGAVRGVLRSMVGMLDDGATHLGVATDHVITSFRNDLWADYKTGEGIDPDLYAQFPWLEDALRALGVTVWAMVEVEVQLRLAISAHTGRMMSFLSGGAMVQVPRRSFNASYLPQLRRDALTNAVGGIFDKLIAHLRRGAGS